MLLMITYDAEADDESTYVLCLSLCALYNSPAKQKYVYCRCTEEMVELGAGINMKPMKTVNNVLDYH